MADVVRCPVCNKINPADLEVCAFCGASLKPDQPPAQPAEDLPDWLNDLRTDESPAQPEDNAPGEAFDSATPAGGTDGEVPDWLSRIRDRSKTEPGEPGDFTDQPAEDADWMKDLSSDPPAGAPGDTDWLSRLGDTPAGAVADAQPSVAGEPGAEPADEIPDWLRDFPAESEHSAKTPEGFVPDITPPESTQGGTAWESPSQSAEDEFSWLDNTRSQAGDAAVEPDQAPAVDDELSSFLARLEGPGEGSSGAGASDEEPAQPHAAPLQPGAGEGGLEWSMPEDQAGETVSSGNAEIFPSAQAGEFSEDSFPNWQPDSREAASGEQSETPELNNAVALPADQLEASAVPDWLQDFSSESPSTQDAGEPTGLPDWLSEEPAAQGEPSSEAEVPTLQDATPQDSTTPESSITPESSTTPAGEPIEPPLAGVEGLAGWFDSTDQTGAGQASGEPSEFKLPEDQEAVQSETASEEAVPDWLRELDETPSSSPETISPLMNEEVEFVPPAVEGGQPFDVDLPDWLKEDQVASLSAANEAGAEAADAYGAGANLAGANLAGTESASTNETGQPESVNADLAEAEIPDWVKEMRPIETIVPEQASTPEADQRIEKAGPLAGLPGILPVEDLTGQYRKPPVYSMKLHVTEKQRSQASLFDSILAEESQPLQIPRPRKQTGGVLLRVVLALILLAVIAIPLIPGLNFGALVTPVLFPRDMQDMFNSIDQSLAPDTPVLLAVDYEPGLSGEMSLAAAALVNQLEAKNARIVAVSTSPSGPALAGQLLSNAQQAHPAYDIAQRTADLGYLPGGTTSLLAFASQPQMVAPAWQSTFLKDLPGLQSFGQIILMTDRAETGRAWIEQVQPTIGKVPLYIVASAQAAPLLEPYVGSGQVMGMVRGVLGGAMYAQLAGQPNNAAAGYLSAYQIGVGLAFILVLVGGVISGSAALVKRNHKDEE